MKRWVFSFILFSFFSGEAQVEQGRWHFGSNVMLGNFNSNFLLKSNDPNLTNIDVFGYGIILSPQIGFFVKDNVLIGLNFEGQFGYTNSKDNSTGNSNISSHHGYYAGPFAERYFGTSRRGRPFFGVSMLYGLGNDTFEGKYLNNNNVFWSTSRTQSKLFMAEFRAGYALFLNESFMLKLFGGIKNTWGKDHSSIDQSTGMTYVTDLKNNAIGVFFGVGFFPTFLREESNGCHFKNGYFLFKKKK